MPLPSNILLKKLIWAYLGIEGREEPLLRRISGEHQGSSLDSYRKTARIIEASDVDYTILRPAWLDDRDVIDYGATQKRESFKNASNTVSRKSVADLILTPGRENRRSSGVHGGF